MNLLIGLALFVAMNLITFALCRAAKDETK